MDEKRFDLIQIDDYVFQIKDNIDGSHLVAEQICDQMNRFSEKNNQLREVLKLERDFSSGLQKVNVSLTKENKELNSIKKFAERNGINIFHIDKAFQKCWKDNSKLLDENERLQQENEKLINKIDFLEKIIDGDL